MVYATVAHQPSVIVKGKPGSLASLEPLSRTYQYRKVMKPMLERKRRARINICLDQLKELMVTALQSEGENVSKLEKADILELTVRHLHKLKRQKLLAANPVIEADRFRAGFTQAANEVSRVLATTPNVDVGLGKRIMSHLGHRMNDLDKVQPLSIHVGQTVYSPASSPISDDGHYSMPLTPSSSRSSHSTSPSPTEYTAIPQGLLKVVQAQKECWQPWK